MQAVVARKKMCLLAIGLWMELQLHKYMELSTLFSTTIPLIFGWFVFLVNGNMHLVFVPLLFVRTLPF